MGGTDKVRIASRIGLVNGFLVVFGWNSGRGPDESFPHCDVKNDALLPVASEMCNRAAVRTIELVRR